MLLYRSSPSENSNCARIAEAPNFKPHKVKKTCLQGTVMYCGIQDNTRDIKQHYADGQTAN